MKTAVSNAPSPSRCWPPICQLIVVIGAWAPRAVHSHVVHHGSIQRGESDTCASTCHQQRGNRIERVYQL